MIWLILGVLGLLIYAWLFRVMLLVIRLAKARNADERVVDDWEGCA